MKTKNFAHSSSLLLMMLLASSCGGGGVFGVGSLGSLLTEPSGSSITTELPPGAVTTSLMSDLELKLTEGNNAFIVSAIQSMNGAGQVFENFDPVALNTAAAGVRAGTLSFNAIGSSSVQAQLQFLNDFGIEYCYDAAAGTYACSVDSDDISAELSQSLGVTASGTGAMFAAVTSGDKIPASAESTKRKALIQAFKDADEAGTVVTASNLTTVIPQCGSDADLADECSLMVQNANVNGDIQSFKVYEKISLREQNKEELELYVKQQIFVTAKASCNGNTTCESQYTLSSAEADKFLMKKAKREFLQININSLLAHGVNIFSVLTYLGYDVSTNTDVQTSMQAMHLDGSALHNIFTQKKNTIVETEYAKEEIFNKNKPGTYLFFEKFLDDSRTTKVADSDGMYQWFVNTRNLCKYINDSSKSESDLQALESDSNAMASYEQSIDDCMTAVQPYIDRFKIIQDLNSHTVSFNYSDDPYIADTRLFYFDYGYDYNSAAKADLNDFKSVVIAIMKREIDDNGPMKTASLDQGDVAFLESISVSGVLGYNDFIEVPVEGDDENAVSDIGSTTLKSKLSLVADTEIYVRIPEDLDSSTKLDFYDANSPFNGSTEGDVIFRMSPSEDALYLAHVRGLNDDNNHLDLENKPTRINEIYRDYAGLNIHEMEFQFPPYKFDQSELFVLNIGVNQGCELADSDNLGCDWQLLFEKESVNQSLAKAYVNLENFTNPADPERYAIGLAPVVFKGFIPVTSGTRAFHDVISITDFDFALKARLRNQNYGSTNIDLQTYAQQMGYDDGLVAVDVNLPGNMYDVGDAESDVINNKMPFKIVSGTYLSNTFVGYPTVHYGIDADLIKSSDGSHEILSVCNAPVDFNTNNGDLLNPLQTVFTSALTDASYRSQYICNN